MKKNQIIAGVVVGLLVIYLTSNLIVDKKLNGLRADLDTKIEEQTKVAVEMTKFFSQGGITEEAMKIAQDCPVGDTNEYDTLLSSLDNGLVKSDLNRLDTLFKQCGSVTSTKRAVMAIQFESNIALLSQLVEERNLLGKFDIENTNIDKWELLSTKEMEISNSFSRLVIDQGRIISAMVENVSPTSMTVENIRASAQAVRESLNSVTSEAFELRSELTKS